MDIYIKFFSAMNVDKVIGQKLKTIRTELHVTQDELAQVIGVSYQQVQKYEKGENRISCSTLVEFSKFLNIDIYYFFSDFTTKNTTKDNCSKSFAHIRNRNIKKHLNLLISELARNHT